MGNRECIQDTCPTHDDMDRGNRRRREWTGGLWYLRGRGRMMFFMDGERIRLRPLPDPVIDMKEISSMEGLKGMDICMIG